MNVRAISIFLIVSCTFLYLVDFLFQIQVAKVVVEKVTYSIRIPTNQSLEENVRSILPFKEKFNDYFKLLGLARNGIGNSSMNSGHIQYFESRARDNECFANLASEYYQMLRKYDEEIGIYSKIGDTTLLKGRPAIIDRVGSDKRKHVAPGYAWDLAMSMSHADKHLAISLIGSCGHDDQIKMFDTRVRCPDYTSSLYAQSSLGNDIVLNQKLTEKIISIQAPTLGGGAIPAKYYHVIAAAFTACMAIKEGVPAWMVKIAQIYAVRAYRAKRLCDRLSNLVTNGPSNSLGEVESGVINQFSQSLAVKPLDEQDLQYRKFFSDRGIKIETRKLDNRILINEMSFKGAIADYNSRYLFAQTFPDSISCNPSTKMDLYK